MNDPFSPQPGATMPVLVGVASARVPVAMLGGLQMELENSGSAYVFIQFGDVTVTASTGTASATAPTNGSYQIGPGICKLVTVPVGTTHMAHISGTAAQTLYATPGNGAS